MNRKLRVGRTGPESTNSLGFTSAYRKGTGCFLGLAVFLVLLRVVLIFPMGESPSGQYIYVFPGS